jgi:transposase
VPEATACPPSVVADTIMRTIELGVMITDAAVDEKQTTIFCSPVARDARCPDCGREGRYRDTVIRPMTDLPVAGYPLVLRVAVPRYRCTTPECGRAVFNQDLGKLAAPRSSTTRRCARYVGQNTNSVVTNQGESKEERRAGERNRRHSGGRAARRLAAIGRGRPTPSRRQLS